MTAGGAAFTPACTSSPDSSVSGSSSTSNAGRVRSASASAGLPRTNDPRPCWVSIQPSCRSADSDLTIVGRDTPNSSTS